MSNLDGFGLSCLFLLINYSLCCLDCVVFIICSLSQHTHSFSRSLSLSHTHTCTQSHANDTHFEWIQLQFSHKCWVFSCICSHFLSYHLLYPICTTIRISIWIVFFTFRFSHTGGQIDSHNFHLTIFHICWQYLLVIKTNAIRLKHFSLVSQSHSHCIHFIFAIEWI